MDTVNQDKLDSSSISVCWCFAFHGSMRLFLSLFLQLSPCKGSENVASSHMQGTFFPCHTRNVMCLAVTVSKRQTLSQGKKIKNSMHWIYIRGSSTLTFWFIIAWLTRCFTGASIRCPGASAPREKKRKKNLKFSFFGWKNAYVWDVCANFEKVRTFGDLAKKKKQICSFFKRHYSCTIPD